MDDLISRQSAIDEVVSWLEDRMTDVKNGKPLTDRLKALPSAQPDIIRCKDCKHYVAHSLFGRSQEWCERLCDEFDKSLARITEPDDYCSRAEGREDG